MKTSKAGLDLIKRFEGLRLEAYKCPAGILTIGYGHTGDVRPGQRITEEVAERYLVADLGQAEAAVTRGVRARLNQNQYDALVSLAYNIGSYSFHKSTLAKMVSENPNDPAIADEFTKWKWATVGGRKQILPGLLRRREAEAALYFKP